jgi:hypothetical protein
MRNCGQLRDDCCLDTVFIEDGNKTRYPIIIGGENFGCGFFARRRLIVLKFRLRQSSGRFVFTRGIFFAIARLLAN